MVEVGQKLPDAEVLLVGEDGQEAVQIADYLASKKVAIFAMPGAFTSTCSSSHLPNVIRHKDGLYEKGVDDVVILVVNDPFVVREWRPAAVSTSVPEHAAVSHPDPRIVLSALLKPCRRIPSVLPGRPWRRERSGECCDIAADRDRIPPWGRLLP